MINFRKLQDNDKDYVQMTKWLNNSYVRKWYGYDDFLQVASLEDVKRKYRDKILNADKANPNVIIINNVEVGYIQYYETDEYLKEKNIYGIDLFIGNDDYRGKGYGSKVLMQIVNYIFETSNAKKIVIDPDIENKIAIKCYLKCGFKELKVIDDHLIMAVNK